MYFQSILLNDVIIPNELSDIKIRMEKVYKQKFKGNSKKVFYREDDWSRIAVCNYLLKNFEKIENILEIGPGPGALLNLLNIYGSYSKVVGIDIRKYSKLVDIADLDIRIMSVDKMSFMNDEFDVIICMEVLEHLEQEKFEKALDELRRVSLKYLIMTVPFREEEPLPSYHKLRFDFNDIERYFPKGQFYLLERRSGTPWIIIIENQNKE